MAPNNAAANQVLPVTDQLNNGIRILQGQTQSVNGVLDYCDTSCDLLNVGAAESYFAIVIQWIGSHPYDVIAILIGNDDTVNVNAYVALL